MMEKLYIIVPAYNEEKNIKNLIDDWYPVVEKYNGDEKSKLVIIDDGSKDNTYKICKEYEASYPLLHVITKKNGGHGQTVLYGYRYAIENKADFIFQTDSDGQTNPKEFDAFWNLKGQYDAIIGNRSKREDGNDRKFVEKTLLFILRIVFGVVMPDSNAPFRLMKKEIVEKYIKKMPEDFNLPNVMLTTFFVYYKEKVKFVDISFKPRQGGVNSINLKKIIKIGWKAVGDFRKIKKEMDK